MAQSRLSKIIQFNFKNSWANDHLMQPKILRTPLNLFIFGYVYQNRLALQNVTIIII